MLFFENSYVDVNDFSFIISCNILVLVVKFAYLMRNDRTDMCFHITSQKSTMDVGDIHCVDIRCDVSYPRMPQSQ